MRRAISWVLRFAATAFALLITPYSVVQSRTYDTDPDIWWHIRVGDWIAAHHAWPRVGIFSRHSDLPWTAYSWGFDLLVSRANHWFGLPGIPGLLICIEILLSLTFLLAMRRMAGSFWPAWWIGTAAICAFYINPLRPALLTLLFFTLELLLIFESERRADDRILLRWIPLLFVAWANCHIQFVYGIPVLGLYVLARIVALAWPPAADGDTPRGSAGQLVVILALALVGSCIGPNWFLPYEVALRYTGQTFVYQIIQEMNAMSFRQPGHYFALVLLMAACFAAGKSKRRDLFRPGLLILCALVSFRSQRDIWFISMAAAFVVAEALRERRDAKASEPAVTAGGIWEPLSFAAATAVAVALSFTLAIRAGMSVPVMIGEIDRVYPIRATEFVRDAHLPGPMYNSFNWGGFLIFNLPEYLVSMDPRTDLYGDAGVRRSIATTNAMDWQDDRDLAQANFVIIERYFPLARALAGDPGYALAYQDPIAMVFVKRKQAP
jgi:hypothetical protein